jgi:hypothetical protein
MTDSRDDLAVSIPVLPSLDIKRTGAFYAKMGFAERVYEAHDYLILRRDRIELHFWLTDDRQLCENTSCYIRGGQIVALHEEYTAAKIPGLKPLETRPWNMLEFYVIDPDGNLLRFGCAPEEVGH